MVVSANVLQVMCIRLGKVESGLDVKAVCTLQRAEPWTRMIATEGPVPILRWLESQATQFVQVNVRSR